MKIRTDYVSNSSSTSFVISANDLSLDKLDEKFFKLIGSVELIYFYARSSGFSKELVNEAKAFFGKRFDVDDTCITLDLNSIKLWHEDTIAIVKKIIAESSELTCSYDCDDGGEFVGEATQICTMLELLYDVVPEGDDHFNYASIKEIGVKL